MPPPFGAEGMRMCGHCGCELQGKSYTVGDQAVCGICSITLARQYPGVAGFDHPNEVNPDRYEGAKEQRLALRWMATQPVGSPNYIDRKTADRWERMFVKRSEQLEHQMKTTPEWYNRTATELRQAEQQAKLDEAERRTKKAMEKLKAIDEQVRMHGIKDDDAG